MKAIVLSDLHIHNYRKFDISGSRLNNCINVLVDVFEYANNHKIDLILFCGDLFDQQKSLPVEVFSLVIEAFYNLFRRFPNIKFISISGNHDQSSKNTLDHKAITALFHLDLIFKNFILIDNDYWCNGQGFRVYGIPYYSHKEHFEHNIPEIDSGGIQLLMIHQTPKHSNSMIPFECTPEDFEDFTFTFCGHIHKHERLSDNFVIVGSPLHRDLSDEGQDKGFLVYDSDTNDYERILLDYPKFERVFLNESPTKIDNYIIPIIEDIEVEDDTNISLNSSVEDNLKAYLDNEGKGDPYVKIGKLLMQ